MKPSILTQDRALLFMASGAMFGVSAAIHSLPLLIGIGAVLSFFFIKAVLESSKDGKSAMNYSMELAAWWVVFGSVGLCIGGLVVIALERMTR